jgi:hypothetical protein
MKVYRYTVWLLMICFSAYLGHNLVPHHHHGEAFVNPISAHCPITHEDQSCSDYGTEGENHLPGKHPLHCHAFNDVVFEKFQTQVVRTLYGQQLITTVPCTGPVPDPAINPGSDGSTCPALLPEGIEYHGSLGLRGPPLNA